MFACHSYFNSLITVQTNTPSNHASPHVGTHTPYSHDQLMVGGVDDPQLPGLNLLDLELLHNYITTTSFTLHTDPAMKILWKINVPQVGFQYDFVMRGVLAISALHMARYKPERKDYYIAHAMQQHQLGLRMATSAMHDLTKENCTGVWLFSALTLFFTLGSPRGPNDFLLVGENGLSDWLFLVKGTSWIIDANEEQLKSGHLGPMFLAGRRRSAIRRESLAKQMLKDNPLDELQGRIRDCGIDGKQVTLCANAVDALRVSFVFIFTPGPVGYETSDILYWVFSLSDEFLQLMKEQTQESMAILAFFCVVLRRLDSQWWLEGWSTHLMAKIWQLLDEEHRYVSSLNWGGL